MKLDLTNLNWTNATVLEFKYIYYLALMLNERTNNIGLRTESFNIEDYEPGGFFRFKQLYDIYEWTIYIGKYYYFNDDHLNAQSTFRHGKRVEHLGFTIDDLCEIAGFDFTKNPLIPDQRLDYYDKFLKPLYLCLKAYNKIWINEFIANDRPTLYHGANLAADAHKEVNHIDQQLTREDLLNYYTLDHAISSEIELIPSGLVRPGQYSYYTDPLSNHKVTFLGGLMECGYQYFYSFGYATTHWVEPGSGGGGGGGSGWSFDSGSASVTQDNRSAHPEDGDFETVNHWHWTAQDAYGGSVRWIFDYAAEHYYTGGEDGQWHEDLTPIILDNGGADISDEYGYAGFSVPAPSNPYATIGNGSITITFMGQTTSDSYSGSPSDGTTFSHSLNGATVTIIYSESPGPGPGPEPTPTGWVIDGHEYSTARNYSGPKFNFYSVIPSTQIFCPFPLLSGATYDLYLYSFAYPILQSSPGLDSVHKMIRDYFYYYEDVSWAGPDDSVITTEAWYSLYVRQNPTILLQPFGDYFKVESGTLNRTFNYFNISLPKKLPYDQSIFNDYPLIEMGHTKNYKQCSYPPHNYDTNIWQQVSGVTVDPNGIELKYIGPKADVDDEVPIYYYTYGSEEDTLIEWWYRPLLIVNYSSLFHYN